VLGDAQLSSTARRLIEDLANTKLISPAVYLELAIKISIGKYKLNEALSHS
jgi:PIN domain nuclease of toxin-antitoxin system